MGTESKVLLYIPSDCMVYVGVEDLHWRFDLGATASVYVNEDETIENYCACGGFPRCVAQKPRTVC